MSLTFSDVEAKAGQMVKDLNNTFCKKVHEDEEYADEVSLSIVDAMISDIMIDVVSYVHRAHKLNYSNEIFTKKLDTEPEEETVFFPEDTTVKQQNINCPVCNGYMHASKFISHFYDKCLDNKKEVKKDMMKDMVRTSSRLSTRKGANSSSNKNHKTSSSRSIMDLSLNSDDEEECKVTPEKNKNGKKVNRKKKKEPINKN